MPKVNLSHYEGGREQAYVKHSLLQIYLPELAFKVGQKWNALVYVDGFAGPWKTHDPDHADSSFGIAIKALRQSQSGLSEGSGRKLNITCVLVEQDKVAFTELERIASTESSPDFEVQALHGEFVNQIPVIDRLTSRSGRNAFKFVLLDPTGWTQIPMGKLKSFLHERSSEVLVTLMTRDINRFLAEPDRADSYRRLFGRDEVLEVLQTAPLNERAERAVLEYSQSLKELCGYKHVSAAVILEPNKESIRYFLVYATNHHRGIEVFKGAEIKASKIQDDIRHQAHIQKTGQPVLMFDINPPKSRKALALRSRFADKARNRVVGLLAAKKEHSSIEYKELFCEAMFFPLVTPNDLVEWIRELEPNVQIRQAGAPTGKKPKPSEDYRVVVINPQALK